MSVDELRATSETFQNPVSDYQNVPQAHVNPLSDQSVKSSNILQYQSTQSQYYPAYQNINLTAARILNKNGVSNLNEIASDQLKFGITGNKFNNVKTFNAISHHSEDDGLYELCGTEYPEEPNRTLKSLNNIQDFKVGIQDYHTSLSHIAKDHMYRKLLFSGLIVSH